MPASGARSGTTPARQPPAGDGRVGPTLLGCGHSTHDKPLVTGPKTLYECPEGCGLMRRIASPTRGGGAG